jgi:HEAT repeat protein
MLTAKTRSQLVYPVITKLPQPEIYRVATNVAVYTPPVADVFVEHALARWGLANVLAAASEARPGTDPWKRVSALCILSRAKADCIHQLLFDALHDKDADIASSAAVFLGQLQDRRAAELLVQALRLNLYLPSFIARQLDNFRIPIDDLLEPLLDLDNAHVRYWAIILLARHGGGERLNAKIARMAEDPDPAIRKAVAQTLGMLDASREALTVLKLLYDDITFVRVHAVKALARFNRPDFSGSLVAMLGDPEWRVRLAAKDALSSMEQAASPDAAEKTHAENQFVAMDLKGKDKLHIHTIDNDSKKIRLQPGSKAGRL